MNAWREEYTKQLGDTANEEEIAKVIITIQEIFIKEMKWNVLIKSYTRNINLLSDCE